MLINRCMRLFIQLSFMIILLGCSAKQIDFNHSEEYSENKRTLESTLIINEYSPKSNTLNEFDEEADWIELFNTSDSALEIQADTWSLSDNKNVSDKYFIPACTIVGNGYLVIWCDKRNLNERDFHSNFKLSGNGEQICLFKNGSLVDQIIFEDDVKKKVSYGRTNDGDETWTLFKSPSPGSSNQSTDNYAETIK